MKTILVVDDDEPIRLLLQEELQDDGLSCPHGHQCP